LRSERFGEACGDEKFGTKVELKNLNSVRFMQRAIEFEVARHIQGARIGWQADVRRRGFGTIVRWKRV
jgi:aspartyl-tRNA(Asn)/glutamyl-tRNA(Gln) amidotransferase subunit B